MMVRIKDGVVAEIIPDYALPVEEWYGQDFALQCVEAPADVQLGWIFDGNIFTEPSMPEHEVAQPTMEERLARLEALLAGGKEGEA